MHPDIFSIGPFTVHSYGTMMVLGFFCGLGLAKLRIKNSQLTWPQMVDLSFYLLLAGILGAKLLFWIIFPREFFYEMSLLFNSPMEFVKLIGNGFVFFGSVVGGAIMLSAYLRKHKISLLPAFDFLAPSLAIGHAFGRIGCFLAGCCYGKVCDLPWAVTFTDPHTLAPPNIPLHPTQLYESLFLFGLSGFLVAIEKKMISKPGFIFALYVLLYTIWRFFLEFYRDDPRGTIFNGLMTTTQGVSIIGAVIASGLILYAIGRKQGS